MVPEGPLFAPAGGGAGRRVLDDFPRGCMASMGTRGVLLRRVVHLLHGVPRRGVSLATGGALGGCFVALIAPMIFTGYFELHAGLLLCVLLFLGICAWDRKPGGE